MIFFPGCKINIGLHVVSKRADGYHDLETLMFPVRGLCDAVEIIRSRTTGVEFFVGVARRRSRTKKSVCPGL